MSSTAFSRSFLEEHNAPLPIKMPALSDREISPDMVRGQVEKILASRGFVRSRRLGQFLRFTVEQFLEGKQHELKEYLVGVEVFEKLESFDPRIDSIVRVEARRLRTKLEQYYVTDGTEDEVVIYFPKGSYVPVVLDRDQSPPWQEAGGSKQLAVGVSRFANLTGELSDESFCSGLAEELISGLTKAEEVRVIARPGETNGFPANVRADMLIEGSIRRHDSKLRICAQLVDAKTGVYVWSDTFDQDTSDGFAAQEGIARRIVSAVQTRPKG